MQLVSSSYTVSPETERGLGRQRMPLSRGSRPYSHPKFLMPAFLLSDTTHTFADWRGMVSKNKVGNQSMNLITAVAAYRENDDTVNMLSSPISECSRSELDFHNPRLQKTPRPNLAEILQGNAAFDSLGACLLLNRALSAISTC